MQRQFQTPQLYITYRKVLVLIPSGDGQAQTQFGLLSELTPKRRG
jgi:hypothetical protein